MKEIKPYILSNRIQPYEWGTRGRQAFIPKLLGMKYNDNLPYAELWMGTHPAAPSQVKISEQLLGLYELIKMYPVEFLGRLTYEHFGANLPFLFKVLSAGKALSIQAHPDKSQAIRLHLNDPGHYPDQNHKPEIAIAIDQLTALVGLLSPDLLTARLRQYSDIQRLVDVTLIDGKSGHVENTGGKLRLFYRGLFQKVLSDPDNYQEIINQLEKKILTQKDQKSEIEQTFLDLKQNHEPTDIGLIMPFFMNLVHLRSGEGLFISAGIPHAYISGNIIECMANSDNVVRIGLTEKFKDIPALLEIMDYTAKPIEIIMPERLGGIKTYSIPVEEFSVKNIRISANSVKVISTDDKIQIGLLLNGKIDLAWDQGNSITLAQGQSVVIPAGLGKYTIRAITNSELFIATTN